MEAEWIYALGIIVGTIGVVASYRIADSNEFDPTFDWTAVVAGASAFLGLISMIGLIWPN